MDESDWCRQSTVREVASIVHTRGTMTMHILVHKGSGSDPSYCSSRTTSENAEACEAKNDDLVMRSCAMKNVKRIWTLVLGTKSILDPSPGNEIHRELLFISDY